MDTDKPEVANIRAAAQQTEVAEPAAKRARTGGSVYEMGSYACVDADCSPGLLSSAS